MNKIATDVAVTSSDALSVGSGEAYPDPTELFGKGSVEARLEKARAMRERVLSLQGSGRDIELGFGQVPKPWEKQDRANKAPDPVPVKSASVEIFAEPDAITLAPPPRAVPTSTGPASDLDQNAPARGGLTARTLTGFAIGLTLGAGLTWMAAIRMNNSAPKDAPVAMSPAVLPEQTIVLAPAPPPALTQDTSPNLIRLDDPAIEKSVAGALSVASTTASDPLPNLVERAALGPVFIPSTLTETYVPGLDAQPDLANAAYDDQVIATPKLPFAQASSPEPAPVTAQEPEWPTSATVVLFAASGNDAVLSKGAKRLTDSGYVVANTLVAAQTLKQSQVRYFYEQDAGKAAAVAEALGIEVETLTDAQQLPAPGTLEVWLAPAKAKAAKPTTKKKVAKAQSAPAPAEDPQVQMLKQKLLDELQKSLTP